MLSCQNELLRKTHLLFLRSCGYCIHLTIPLKKERRARGEESGETDRYSHGTFRFFTSLCGDFAATACEKGMRNYHKLKGEQKRKHKKKREAHKKKTWGAFAAAGLGAGAFASTLGSTLASTLGSGAGED